MFVGTSCKKSNNNRYERDRYNRKVEVAPKYQKGDIVYLKPDSLKVVIFDQCPCSKTEYDVYWFDKNSEKHTMKVDDALIFSKIR
jgi:hypothetical protein